MPGTPLIMTHIFKNALVRKPSKSIINALSSRNIKPEYELILKEHNDYVKGLKNSGILIHNLESLKNFPDSVFIEDPALIYKSNCIILKPYHPSRIGESKIIKNEIVNYFQNIFIIENGNIEGGDILNINNHFIIGLSKRTNELGAKNLSILLKLLGASVKICKTSNDILHFKSECSYIDEETLLVSQRMSKIDYLRKNFQLIKLPEGEELAANALRVNNKILIADGFFKIEEILSSKYDLIKININEISKIDAGLSCMSLRW